ncbi:MAG: transporter [Planctomycetes bacterium]|nr:transporter [Planctomycetota bacterium]
MKRLLLASLLVFCLTAAAAAETGRYPAGIEGVRAGTVPGEGFYLREYMIYYAADTLADKDGNDVPVDFEADLFTSASRFIYMTGAKLIGGDVGFDVVLVFNHAAFSIDELNIDESNTRFGDFVFKPLLLSWHWERVDAAAAPAIFTPTGDPAPHNAALANRDRWTVDLEVAATWHLDAEKTWALAGLLGYEFNTESPTTDIQPGQALHLEWCFSHTVSTGIDLGVTGTVSWQTTDDDGDGVTYDPGIHDRVFSVGPEVNCFIPSLLLNIQARHLWEFGAEDRAEGQASVLCITKIF